MFRKGIIYIFCLLLLSVPGWTQSKYKKFDTGGAPDTLIKIDLTSNAVIFNIKNDSDSTYIQFTKNDIEIVKDTIYIKQQPVMTKEGFIVNGNVVDINDIDKLEMDVEDESSRIIFLKSTGTTKYTFKSKKTNIIKVNEPIKIEKKQFVRGTVISFWEDIAIEGEINEDVLAVFGNIKIGDSAVIRGHVAAIGGKVFGGQKATVYGNVMASGRKGNYAFTRNSKGMMIGDHISEIYRLYYNRVDGIAPYFGFRFFENDTLVPEIIACGGYAFASEQPRYYFGIEHTLHIPQPLVLGAAFYKRLASDDDWIVSELNNTIYALLATEDYKNYYDAQGGHLYAGYYPLRDMYLRVGVKYEKHKWLSAHPRLWSLTGGAKDFFANYSNLDDPIRNIDGDQSETFKFFTVDLDYKPPHESDQWNGSYWQGSVNLEWFPGKMNDNLEYMRTLVKAKRQQRLNDKFVFRSELTIGGSAKSIPDYRKFSIGGMGTLHGFDRKEFTGTDFWLGNLELGYKPLKEVILLWLFYDVGGISNSASELSDAEVLHSLGAGISLGDYIRLYTARRFDRSNADLTFGVKLNFAI